MTSGTDGDAREVARLWRVYKTIHHMLHDRGYAITQSELDLSLTDFVQTFEPSLLQGRKDLTLLVQRRDDPAEHLFVFFPDDYSIGVKPIRSYVEKMVEQSVFRSIVVIRNAITPAASKVCVAMAPKYVIEQFMENELIVNITEHKLVPQHQLMTEDEKKQLLTK